MRDAHRLKEKVDLSLDGGQVAGLVIGALACLGVVFASGVVVGKRLAAQIEPEQPADVLAALDKKSAGERMVMEAARGEGLQEQLTAPAAPAPVTPPPAPVAPKVEPKVEPMLAAVAEPVAPPPPPPPAALPPPPAAAGDWTVQIAATQEKNDAERRATQLRARGLQPFLSGATLPGKGRFWRVQVGRFKNRDDAERYKRDLAREGGFQAFVTKISS